jgi:hypothetical protein
MKGHSDSQCPGRHWNRAPPEYQSEVLPLGPAYSLSPDSESAKGLLGKFRWKEVIFQVMKYRNFLCILYYKRNPYKGEILDASYYWSRKQEHLIKARGYSVAVVASTGELYDRKNKRRRNRPFSFMLCVFCSASYQKQRDIHHLLFFNKALRVFPLFFSILCLTLWFYQCICISHHRRFVSVYIYI